MIILEWFGLNEGKYVGIDQDLFGIKKGRIEYIRPYIYL